MNHANKYCRERGPKRCQSKNPERQKVECKGAMEERDGFSRESIRFSQISINFKDANYRRMYRPTCILTYILVLHVLLKLINSNMTSALKFILK